MFDFISNFEIEGELFFTKWIQYQETFSLMLIDFNVQFDKVVSFQYLESFFFGRLMLEYSRFDWLFIMDLKVNLKKSYLAIDIYIIVYIYIC